MGQAYVVRLLEEKYSVWGRFSRNKKQFPYFSDFLRGHNLFEYLIPFFDEIKHNTLDCWAISKNNQLPLYAVEIKISTISYKGHDKRGKVELTNNQREYFYRIWLL